MTRRRQKQSSGGFTFVEIMVSMAAASALLAGLTSTMFVALRASNPNSSPAASMLEALSCMADMSAELQYAVAVTESTANALTVIVPDRSDADATPETIRYAWSGVAGAALTRSYNGATGISVIPGVQSFAVVYYPSAAAPQYIIVQIQPTTSARSFVETAIGLLNL